MRWYANFVDAKVGPLVPCLPGEKLRHSEKIAIFQSLRYFHHDETTGKGTSY